jgi:glycosyltransferase involved in cell wall biosynthesis
LGAGCGSASSCGGVIAILAEVTGSTRSNTSFDRRWRGGVLSAQEAVLPEGSTVVTCFAPFGEGGLGRHLEEIVDALRRSGRPARYIGEPLRETPAAGPWSRSRATLSTMVAPVLRLSPAWHMWAACVDFDRCAARRLPPADHLIAFNGTAVAQFARARATGKTSLALVSATSHLRTLLRQHALAYRQYPIEGSWAGRMLPRNLLEYAQAQRIYVSSRYIWESFVEEGISEDRLVHFPLTPHERFSDASASDGRPVGGARTADDTSIFTILYVGSLSVVKGVPLLIEAVSRLEHRDLRLVLLGGWATRGMRRFIERARARDPRIEVCLDDPLVRMRDARLYVHPSYDDGFGYAPAEALAARVPVIVSENTGMKELIETGYTGVVVPTGEPDTLALAIDAAYRGELLGR